MADPSVKRRIRDILRRDAFPDADDRVIPRDGHVEELVHLDVISHRFDKLNTVEAHDLLEAAIAKYLPRELESTISLLTPIRPAVAAENGRGRPKARRRPTPKRRSAG